MFVNNNDRTCSFIDEFVNGIKIIKKYFVGDFINNDMLLFIDKIIKKNFFSPVFVENSINKFKNIITNN